MDSSIPVERWLHCYDDPDHKGCCGSCISDAEDYGDYDLEWNVTYKGKEYSIFHCCEYDKPLASKIPTMIKHRDDRWK